MSGFRLRPEQQRVVDEYRGGYAAISAVPGAGKTTTLSALAAELIQQIEPRQRVVIVTYQNAAVANFQRAVTERLTEQGLQPRGFMVRTLHSLALEVLASVRHRAELDVQARVIEDAEATEVLNQIVSRATARHHDLLISLATGHEVNRPQSWPSSDAYLLGEVAKAGMRLLRPHEGRLDDIRDAMSDDGWLPFVLDVYESYRTELREQGLLEYDDLVYRAVQVLEESPVHRRRMRRRWPYILEDEAQDSSDLQERMLRLLAGDGGNLVRVGDANQAILTTFTASSVEGFRNWLSDPNVAQKFELAGSSRSTTPILQVANGIIQRVHASFPVEESRTTALRRQSIDTVWVDGVLQNPPAPTGNRIGLDARGFETTEDERDTVIDLAVKYLKQQPQATVAILVGSRNAGYEYATALTAGGFPDNRIIRLLGGRDGRPVGLIERLNPVLGFLARPDSPELLIKSLEAWSGDPDTDRVVHAVRDYLRLQRGSLKTLLYPSTPDELDAIFGPPYELAPTDLQSRERLRAIPDWLDNRLARPHELVGLISTTIGADEDERRLLDAITSTLSGIVPDPKVSRFDQLRETLGELHKQSRKLRGTHEEHVISIEPGSLTISTRHQAKGLEWDVVFAVNCDDFWFRGSLDYRRRWQRDWLGPWDPALVVEAEIERVLAGLPGRPTPDELSQITRARSVDEVSEGLRVMYVTVTRARRALWLSWHREGSEGPRRVARFETPVFSLVADLIAELRLEARSATSG